MWAPFVQFKSRFLLTWVMKSWNCWVDKIQMRIQNVFCHIAKISAHAKIIMQFFANWWATTCNLLMTCRGVALSVCSNNVHIVIKTDWSVKKILEKKALHISGKSKVQPNVHDLPKNFMIYELLLHMVQMLTYQIYQYILFMRIFSTNNLIDN